MSDFIVEPQAIGDIGNEYGGLEVCTYEGKFYWIIQGYPNNPCNQNHWEEIPESLYNELIKFNSKKPNQ